ncbi:BN159_2729 family protein [Streptomyces sp. NPDC046977]|uniref:BN159_2729 family protein n=1 Tax=Streptomyces sp. NPDC046977 TaxID=3154703 RepID=UPI0033F3FA94
MILAQGLVSRLMRTGVGAALLPVAPIAIKTPAEEPPQSATTLEAEAVAWDTALIKAERGTAALTDWYSNRDDVTSISQDRDRVVITLDITSLSQWFRWLQTFPDVTDRYIAGEDGGLLAVADGTWNGAQIRLQSTTVAELVTQAADTARHPVWVNHRLYDLSEQLVDATGGTWEHTGEWAHDGTPLIADADTGAVARLDDVARGVGIRSYTGEQPATDEQPPADERDDTDADGPAQEMSPAGELALRLGNMPRAAGIDGFAVMGQAALKVTVRPQTTEAWSWWLDAFGIQPDRITYDDTTASATGTRDGVTVALIGLDAAGLIPGGDDDA